MPKRIRHVVLNLAIGGVYGAVLGVGVYVVAYAVFLKILSDNVNAQGISFFMAYAIVPIVAVLKVWLGWKRCGPL